MDLPTVYQEFINKRSYSRYIDELGRREDFSESVERYAGFMIKRVPFGRLEEFGAACDSITRLDVMPSMRAMWTAGIALERENACAYNCGYVPIEKPKDFADLLYLLMCGTGVGVSVERQYINKLPAVPENISYTGNGKPVVFEDSKRGWADGFNKFLFALFNGTLKDCDLNRIRPEGERLKTFGGRASGPGPLRQLLDFTVNVFLGARGRKLNSVECYDICCYIANVVVVGGVRRSAIISLSNFSDKRMAHAKDGDLSKKSPHRYLSNNSVAYTEKPDCTAFMEEWLGLARSGSGERGIFNREGAKHIAGLNGRRDPSFELGTNPCSEIILRPREFCNLTEVVVSEDDTAKTLAAKVRKATILGIVQSTLTDFRFIDPAWAENCKEERLLGVSLTGLRDNPCLNRVSVEAQDTLDCLKYMAIQTAKKWSHELGINMPAAITCVKPSGTVSQLVNSASGLHARFAPYYIRRVRVSIADPIAQFMIDSGVPWKPENGETIKDFKTAVFEFPIESPASAVFRNDVNAIEQLEYWKMLQVHWCEHKPSCTIYVKEHEWFEVGNWVYKNWDLVSGIAFLPYDGGVYQLPPYEEITRKEYLELQSRFPVIDFDDLGRYEHEDMTTGATEFACVGGNCEI